MWLGSLTGALGAWRDRRRALAELATLKREAAPTDNWATDIQLQQAKVALDRLDMQQAELLWAKAKAGNLARAQASPDGLKVVLGLRRFDEADKLMADGMKRSPGNSFFFEGYAQVAQSRLDYAEAVKRWQNVRRKFSMLPAGYHSGAHCLTELARFDEAHSILTQALRRFPNDFHLRMEHAQLAMPGAQDKCSPSGKGTYRT
jgi:predicted Zn-dependent protease